MALLATNSVPVAAQLTAGIGAGYSFADYREQAAFLHFQGSGPSATLNLQRGRLGIRIDATHLRLNPVGQGSLESFTADQYTVRLGVKPMSLIAIEAGFSRRSAQPSRAAQSFTAATLGLRADYPLAPGTSVSFRTAYMSSSGFTGGGSAPFGIELGLGAAYSPGPDRLRMIADYDFQRIDRHTDHDGIRASVPIQSSVARFGVEVRF